MNIGLESLKERTDGSKLKWWYKVNDLVNERYPKLLLDNVWEVNPVEVDRGRLGGK